jgi:acyl carrier protein
MSSGTLDSLSMLEVVMGLEEIYGVSLDAFELNPDNFDTVDDIARLIHSKLPGTGESS